MQRCNSNNKIPITPVIKKYSSQTAREILMGYEKLKLRKLNLLPFYSDTKSKFLLNKLKEEEETLYKDSNKKFSLGFISYFKKFLCKRFLTEKELEVHL